MKWCSDGYCEARVISAAPTSGVTERRRGAVSSATGILRDIILLVIVIVASVLTYVIYFFIVPGKNISNIFTYFSRLALVYFLLLKCDFLIFLLSPSFTLLASVVSMFIKDQKNQRITFFNFLIYQNSFLAQTMLLYLFPFVLFCLKYFFYKIPATLFNTHGFCRPNQYDLRSCPSCPKMTVVVVNVSATSTTNETLRFTKLTQASEVELFTPISLELKWSWMPLTSSRQ